MVFGADAPDSRSNLDAVQRYKVAEAKCITWETLVPAVIDQMERRIVQTASLSTLVYPEFWGHPHKY